LNVRVGWAVLLACSLASQTGRAEERACTPSFEGAQERRARGERIAAREDLLACIAVCTDELRRYCAAWLTEIEAELGAAVIVARRDGANLPLTEVRVRVDGEEQTPYGGRVFLEPGAHRVEVIHLGETVAHTVSAEAGGPPASVLATFGGSAPAVDRGGDTGEGSDEGLPVVVAVLLGIGGAALVGAAALAINGHRLRGELEDSCSPRCDPDLSAPIRTQWVISGVLAGVGAAVLIGTGVAVAAGGEPDGAGVAVYVRREF
jgi:hypothetical protein